MPITTKIVSFINAIPAPIAAPFRRDTWLANILRPLVNQVVPAEPTEVIVRSGHAAGLHLYIRPREEKFYWTGAYEEHTQDLLVRLLQPSMTFWDVGTHIGFLSMLAARIVGETGHVHSFEPMPENRARLQKAIAANGFSNISVHETALAAIPGAMTLHPGAHSTTWTLMAEHGDDRSVAVVCDTLDNVTDSYGVPDLIKIDVEGAEVDVLRGGIELLAMHRPRLLVEFHDDANLQTAKRLLPTYHFEQIENTYTPERTIWLLT